MEAIQIQKEKLLSLSTFVKVLLENKVFTLLVDKFRRPEVLKKMKKTLSDLQDVLLCHDLEKVIPNPDVNQSLDLLRHAVFHVAFAFKELNFSWYGTSSLEYCIYVIDSNTINLFEILQGISSNSSTVDSHETPPTSSSILDAESSIYGRDADIKKLKHLLLSSDSDGDSKVRVISIVGMGGVGKTALAKHLYNHPQVKDKFELKLWVDFSTDVNDLSVFENILGSITSQTTTNDTTHINTIYPSFLLVLDGVWDARSVNWTLLMDIFNAAGETQSKVIVTTRDERVALSMQTFLSLHYLRPLKVEDCWSIVANHAFGEPSYQRYNREKIGRKIAKKCDGLPLAAIAHGALLRMLFFPSNLNHVLESHVRERAYQVLASLKLSYNFLSDPLKRCFEYCSIFPKKSILEKKMVVHLWIATGLVESSSSKYPEKVGEEYFDELVSRSLIHRRSIGDDEERNFEMHDLIHDVAREVSSPYCINMDKHNLHDRVHTLSYNREAYDSNDKFYKLSKLNGLRTFVALPLQEQLPLCLLSNKVLHDLLPTMIQLRVLSLSSYKSITKVPDSIGNLLYMQYLNLSHTNIVRLPSEICKLYRLQFLLLAGCKRFTELPKEMGKLINLRYLDVSNTALREMPVQIAKLVNIHTLSDFVISKHNGGLNIAHLGKFLHLHGKLSISQLQNVNEPFEVDRANIKMKEQIDELALEWDCDSTTLDSQIQNVVLEKLRPSTNLKSLTIKGYGGISIPNWLGDSLFSNMVYLRISNCNDCLWLPPLGKLGNLKELVIEGMHSVETIGIEFYGSGDSSFQPFPSLESLHFENMQEWEEWDLIGGTATMFPSLKTLLLSKCPKLTVGNLTDKFSSLTKLELRECPLVVQSMPLFDHVFRQLMLPLNSLQQLTLDGISSSLSFPRDGLAKTLKFLIITNCENLEFLPHEYLSNYTLLEELKISYSCNSMISFTLGALPILKSLFIEGCKNLKSILIAEDASLKSLSFLKSIKIWDCSELESFTLGGLATPNLRYIAIWKCEKLHSLPEAMNNLAGLQEMEIDNLPNLQSFVIDELPGSLQKLSVGSVGGIKWSTEPSWEHLTCLSVLRINGDDMVSTLMRPLLPTSLVTLCICGLNDTSIDEKWFQRLTSLENLEIINAPKLKSLPKKGFPSSLSVLSVTCCPLLEASLQKKRGKEWRKIAHIPSIIIDDELIT
ncbi:putative disease resistance protein At3g14460 [Vicia villosa]|uniref:putative disease resistance protein At3g14460 n=1 Tax=Vicia villosa TaxID=3911 RepID=UPI00273C2D0A|nr:putative disease resistance protein At3g14460 [Vicia villosa]XP_058782479.1 putative disease resistance protein At3g14460 [Vicia villosa]